jgi:hypothetical protein
MDGFFWPVLAIFLLIMYIINSFASRAAHRRYLHVLALKDEHIATQQVLLSAYKDALIAIQQVPQFDEVHNHPDMVADELVDPD